MCAAKISFKVTRLHLTVRQTGGRQRTEEFAGGGGGPTEQFAGGRPTEEAVAQAGTWPKNVKIGIQRLLHAGRPSIAGCPSTMPHSFADPCPPLPQLPVRQWGRKAFCAEPLL